jgi:hypothetical protein
MAEKVLKDLNTEVMFCSEITLNCSVILEPYGLGEEHKTKLLKLATVNHTTEHNSQTSPHYTLS